MRSTVVVQPGRLRCCESEPVMQYDRIVDNASRIMRHTEFRKSLNFFMRKKTSLRPVQKKFTFFGEVTVYQAKLAMKNRHLQWRFFICLAFRTVKIIVKKSELYRQTLNLRFSRPDLEWFDVLSSNFYRSIESSSWFLQIPTDVVHRLFINTIE